MRAADRLRIALFTYATQPRGGVLHALALAETLCARGHDAVLHALDDTGRGFVRSPRCPTVIVRVAPHRGPTAEYAATRIAAYVDGWQCNAPFDVYHAHDSISGNALATLTERGAIPGYVRTVHHLEAFTDPAVAVLQDRAVMRAAYCLVVSEHWRERLAADYAVAATVVPNGVDTARFVPAESERRAAQRAELGYAAGPLFVTIGGLEARKNTLATLEAFARVRAALPAARLVIVGGASVLDHSAYRRACDARAAELGLRYGIDVVLAGVLPDAQVVALLQAADALVFPSLVEGFGLVVLEALACGTPVVTSAIAPFTEYLSPADALLIDPRDTAALAAALVTATQPAARAAARERGPALAARFSWQASARAHVAAYRAYASQAKAFAHA